MRNRTFLYLLVGFVLAAVLVCAATDVSAGNSRDLARWAAFQRKTPLLWMVDGCAVIILLGSWLFGAAIENQSQSRKSSGGSAQVGALLDRIVDLEELAREQAARIETLEQAGSEWHDGFDTEAARLTEQAFLALSDNIEANAKQLETITMALRYQRAEMKALRTAVKTGELAAEGEAPSLETGPRPPRAVTPQLKRPQKSDLEHTILEEAPDYVAVVIEEEVIADEPEPAAEVPDEQAEEHPMDQQPDLSDTHSDAEELVDVESEVAADHTVNAGSVASADFDIEKDKKEKQSQAAKAEAAANEFNRSKSTPGSIFRRKQR